MSLATKQSQKIWVWQFFVTVLICLSSCKKEESKIAHLNGHVQNFRSSKTVDSNNLVELAKLGKETLETNTNLGFLSANNRIVNFSRAIRDNQNDFLESIARTASSELIIINGIYKIDKRKDTIRKDVLYFDSIEKNLQKQISLLETLKTETTDDEINLFALQNLKKQNRILEMTKRFRLKILNNITTEIK